LEDEKKTRRVLEKQNKLTDKERKEYDILKAKKKEKQQKAVSKKRASASRPGKKKRK
jgi:hypothetical protein